MIEKFYRRILDGIPTAIVVVNEKLKAVFSNSKFKELFPSPYRRVSLGRMFCCADCEEYGERALNDAFEDCIYSGTEIDRRLYLKIKTREGTRDVAFNISIKPLGDNMYMGVIDNAFELEIARELNTAKDIQQRLLPAGTWAGKHRYAYMYIPCRGIGGDLPDVYTIGDSAFGVIADVSGKGISAGMLSAFVKAAYDKTEFSPAQSIRNLCIKFNELGLDERSYVTIAAVRIDEDSITYSMAGHNVPILLKSAGGITRITLNSPPVSNWFDNPAFFEDTINYSKGDILVLLTDGVTESKSPRGEMFGSERAVKTLSVSRSSDEFVKKLHQNLRTFCSEFNDDITAIAFDL